MANYNTAADLVADILGRSDEAIDGTSDFDALALQYLNRAYIGIWRGGAELDPRVREAWWWLRKDAQGVITLDPSINAGSVAITNNNAGVTFSSAPTLSVSGWHLKVDTHPDVFILTDHTIAQTGGTLESVYTGPDDTAAAYKVFHLDYSLATDVLYLSHPMSSYRSIGIGRGHQINYIDMEPFKQKWPLQHIHVGTPHNFTMLGERKVRFSHSGGVTTGDLIKIDYEYIREPADLTNSATSIPVLPRQYRTIISDWGTALLLEDKSDNRAKDALKLAQNGLQGMALDHRSRSNRAGGTFGQIITRQGAVLRLQGPLRTESGLIIG
jgi:hypothetical protein